MENHISFKGFRDGLLVTLPDQPWQVVEADLYSHLDTQAGFLKGAYLAVDVGSRDLRAIDLGRLRDRISARGLVLWAVLSASPKTVHNAQSLGLATHVARPGPDYPVAPTDSSVQAEPAVLLQHTLQAGSRLHHPGHVAIIGDIAPGAEVVAGGNIVVWGRLGGVVHAGAAGQQTAVICALALSPLQLRIADVLTLPPKRRGKLLPEIAFIQAGQILVERWKPKKDG